MRCIQCPPMVSRDIFMRCIHSWCHVRYLGHKFHFGALPSPQVPHDCKSQKWRRQLTVDRLASLFQSVVAVLRPWPLKKNEIVNMDSFVLVSMLRVF